MTELSRYIDFCKMVVIPLQIYFRFRVWLRLTFLNVQSYLYTKCGPDISLKRLRYYYLRFLKVNGRHT